LSVGFGLIKTLVEEDIPLTTLIEKGVSEIQEQVIKEHNRVQLEPGLIGVPFGFKSLDEITLGQQPGDLNILIGPTGVAKSYIAGHIGLSGYKNGKNILMISPEMPELQAARRNLAIQSKLSDEDLRKGGLSIFGVKKAREVINEPVYVDGEKKDNYFKLLSSGLYTDVNKIITVAKEYKPHLLIVDGVYMIKDSQIISSSAWREDESVLMKLKQLCISEKIPGLAVTQYNRSNPGKLSGARGTQSVEQLASNFISIDFENPEDKETQNPRQTRRISVKKSRDGAKTNFKVNLDFTKGKIEEDTSVQDYLNQGKDENYMEDL